MMLVYDVNRLSAVTSRTAFGRLLLTLAATLIATQAAAAVAAASGAGADLSGVWWSKNPQAALRPVEGGEPPFTPAGKALYDKRRQGLKDRTFVDRTWKYCLPSGVPRVTTSAYPFQIVQTSGQVTLLYEENHAFRSILLDEKLPAQSDDLEPYYMGHSVGRWEDDTLVIETTGFNDETLLDATGIPHSDKLRVVERLHRIDGGQRLEAKITITDSEIFSKPWTTRRVYEFRPDVRLQDFVCGEPKRDLSQAKQPPKAPATENKSARAAEPAGPVPDLAHIWYYDGGPMRTGERPTPKAWAAAIAKKYADATAAGAPLATATGQRCLPAGVPQIMSDPYPIQIFQLPHQVIVLNTLDHQIRFIHLNEPHPANLKPTWYGHSTGHYENDSLIIDTIGLTDKTQLEVEKFDVTPNSDALHVIERIRVVDGGDALEDHIYVEDPKALEKPYSYTLTFKRIRSMKTLEEYACAQNNRDGQPVTETDPRPDFR